MKILIFITLITTALFSESLNYVSSLQKAKEIAKQRSKKILMIYSSPTCPECERMKHVVFKDKNLKHYLNKNYVLIDLDITRDNLPYGFSFIGVPTFFVLNSDLKEIAKLQGSSKDAKTFLMRFKNRGL